MDWQTRMNRAINYIEENLTESINLEAAAQLAGFSIWEFQRMFSFVAGNSLGEYIRGRRLDFAANDIQTGDVKVIDIALRYGYDSPAAFSRAFNRQFGVSPSLARRDGIKLKPFPKITFQTYSEEGIDSVKTKNDMHFYSERGYYVVENAPIYYTPDMEKTVAWFRDILGWYGDTVVENEGGYGCVFDYPGELIVSGLVPFRGIHLFKGEPSKDVVGFIRISGLEKFRQFVLENGWHQISEIELKSWGASECRITTIDGCILRFFETIAAQ
ncbi:MAG: helix-turn-helix domain-containing protein [Defluviitaleaceae bacterium]|nr:helix-turn-helix domain-containing protein [Defluviitaleaceae bacterium]